MNTFQTILGNTVLLAGAEALSPRALGFDTRVHGPWVHGPSAPIPGTLSPWAQCLWALGFDTRGAGPMGLWLEEEGPWAHGPFIWGCRRP